MSLGQKMRIFYYGQFLKMSIFFDPDFIIALEMTGIGNFVSPQGSLVHSICEVIDSIDLRYIGDPLKAVS